ncbi:MAG: hypothetical protein V3S84_04690 [Dehalococcoidales bacterium]
MYLLRTILNWGWCPITIAVLSVIFSAYELPVWVLAPVLVAILAVGLAAAVIGVKESELERASQKLRQLSGHFNRRFMGSSSLSIFAVINSLFNVDEPKLWDWARACDISQRIFNTWCNSFIDRVESDIRARSFSVYLHTYLNELWLVNSHYYEFIEQFYEVAAKVEVPPETIEQYNKLVVEYNAFVNDFRDNVTELKKVAKTEIDPASLKLAQELLVAKSPQPIPKKEEKLFLPPQHKGYIL